MRSLTLTILCSLAALLLGGCLRPGEVNVPPPAAAPEPVTVENLTGGPLRITFDAHLLPDQAPIATIAAGNFVTVTPRGGQRGFTLLALDARGEIVGAYLAGDPCGCAWVIR